MLPNSAAAARIAARAAMEQIDAAGPHCNAIATFLA
jgi:hypothetical protein